MIKRIYRAVLLLCACLLLGACGSKEKEAEDYHIDFSDPSQGIYTAADLLAFFEQGESNVATLGGSVDLAGEMLKLSKSRGSITLIGNGNSITSGGDCVIRMEDGASLTLNDVTLVAGADGIGCLGEASVGGKGLRIEALTNGIHSAGNLNIQAGSDLYLQGQKGSGLIAKSLLLEKDVSMEALGSQSAVHTLKNDVTLEQNAKLFAQTSEYYCALKCAGILRMEDGAALEVENLGDYHGAEVQGLQVEGKATIKAKGGSHGTGMFLFGLNDEITVAGYCEPELRFESGRGALHFVESTEQIPEPTSEPETEGETQEESAGSAEDAE